MLEGEVRRSNIRVVPGQIWANTAKESNNTARILAVWVWLYIANIEQAFMACIRYADFLTSARDCRA
jgi:hypothetical protein